MSEYFSNDELEAWASGPPATRNHNVIFLTIDALSHSGLGIGGHPVSPAPALDSIGTAGSSLDRCFSTGAVTQFAMPGLMSSTMPLDYSGYDRGVMDRPTTIAEQFSNLGYRTGAFVSAWWQDALFGYDRGVDEFYSMCDLSMFLSGFQTVYLNYYREAVENGTIALETAQETLIPFLNRFLDRLIEFSAEKDRERDASQIVTSPTLHAGEWPEIQQTLTDLREAMETEQTSAVEDLVVGSDTIFDKLLEDRERPTVEQFPLRFGLKSGLVYTWKNHRNILSALSYDFPSLAGTVKTVGDKYRFNQQVRVPSAAYQFENALRWIDKSPDEPFFLWIHLMDVHDRNTTSWEFPERSQRDRERLDSYSQSIRQSPTYEGNIYYDLAIRYVDSQLREFLAELAARNCLQETSLVVTGDHGHTLAERPLRPNSSIIDFYDDLYHVPLLFANTGSKPTDQGLLSSLDIGPTLFDLLGQSIPSGFDGRSVVSDGPREYVLMEHAGKGPCDLERKTIYVAGRTTDRKMVLMDGTIDSYCDLRTDPMEHQLKRKEVDPGSTDEQYQDLEEILKNRYQEIQS